MKRLSAFTMIVMAVAAMGTPPKTPPIPGACDVLRAIDIAAALGPGTTYAPITETETDLVRLSTCSADTPDLAVRMTLMVRESLAANVPDAAVLKDQSIAGLRDVIGADAVIEDVALGDAATWVGAIGQLTVWHRAGRVMYIFSPTPAQDRAAAEAAAQKVLAAFP